MKFNHPQLMYSLFFILVLFSQAHNLRSAVAKNAILAIEDMFFGLRHRADAEVVGVSAALIKVIVIGGQNLWTSK